MFNVSVKYTEIMPFISGTDINIRINTKAKADI